MVLYVFIPLLLGPTFGGILYDALTFKWAALFIVAMEMIAMLTTNAVIGYY